MQCLPMLAWFIAVKAIPEAALKRKVLDIATHDI